MRCDRVLVLLGLLLAFISTYSGSPALAATPDFTITATNATMSSSSSSGFGSSSFTLTSVNGYTGKVAITCVPPSPPTGGKVPVCGGSTTMPAYTLTANQVVTGSIPLYNMPVPIPVSLPRRGSHGPAPGLALAGALLLGFGIRRGAGRFLTLTLLALEPISPTHLESHLLLFEGS